ncbi:MAG: GspH/FimT family pseudopilin [Bacteroidota bacterium]
MSLLEALVALAIVGLIGTLAYPRLEQASNVAVLRHTVTVLVQDLRRARTVAVRSGDAAVVVPAPGGHGYLLPDQSLRPLPDGLALQAAGPGIRFFPDGSASGGRVTVTGSGGLLAVAVDPTTGAATMVRP